MIALTHVGTYHRDAALPPTLEGRLSRRQCQVVARVAQGLTNKQIAGELGIRPESVRTYIKRAIEKLEIGKDAPCEARVMLARTVILAWSEAA